MPSARRHHGQAASEAPRPAHLRIEAEERGLIDRAAMLTGKTRMDFVLEAARHAAQEALLDYTVLTVTPEALRRSCPGSMSRYGRMMTAAHHADPSFLGLGVPLSRPKPLADAHDLGDVCSGVDVLNDWLKRPL